MVAFFTELAEEQPDHRRQDQAECVAEQQEGLLNADAIGEHADQRAGADKAEAETERLQRENSGPVG